MYSESTSLSSKPTGNWTLERILSRAISLGAKRLPELVDLLLTYFSQDYLNGEFLAIQSAHETDWWRSKWWSERLNPAGIGITGYKPDDDRSKTWTSGREAAIAHMTHLALYHYGKNLPNGFPGEAADDPRWDAAIDAGYDGSAHEIADLTMTWAWDGNEPNDPQTYSEKLVDRLNAKAPNVAEYFTAIQGLPGGRKLRTNHPVFVKYVPASQTRQRPGIKAGRPRRSVQHGNGNYSWGSTARSEMNYVLGGSGGRQASYHSATDEKETCVMLPADEVGWHAADGGGPGNMNGFANEMVESDRIWSDTALALRTIDHAANFMGGIAAHLGIAKPEQHWDFNYNQPASQRHDCPNRLRHRVINGRKAWDIYTEKWYAYRKLELARITGEIIDDVVDPKPQPEYAKPVIIEALRGVIEYKSDDFPVVTVHEGTDFTLTNDVVEATTETPRLAWAARGAKELGQKIRKGERFIVRLSFRAADGELYYLTPYWTRVRQKDTKFVSDVPVLETAA